MSNLQSSLYQERHHITKSNQQTADFVSRFVCSRRALFSLARQNAHKTVAFSCSSSSQLVCSWNTSCLHTSIIYKSRVKKTVNV